MLPLADLDGSRNLEDRFPELAFEIPLEGAVPVQAWGAVDSGERFYFRWRGHNATLTVGHPSRSQPATASDLVAEVMDMPLAAARAIAADVPPRTGEIYPDGITVRESTRADENISEAAAVFESLYVRLKAEQRTPAD